MFLNNRSFKRYPLFTGLAASPWRPYFLNLIYPSAALCYFLSHAASVLQAQGRQPHEEVRKFYASHYSSNIMKGAVMGPQSLDELERMVRSQFQAVGNADLRLAEFDGAHSCPSAQALQGTPEQFWRCSYAAVSEKIKAFHNQSCGIHHASLSTDSLLTNL